MPYRSSLAQAVHNAVLKFIDNEITLDTVTKTIDQLDSEALCEESKNGHSHLHDVLHLPFTRIDNKEEASNKAIYLMNILFKKAYSLGKGKLAFLLTHADSQGFTPLHEALIAGNPTNMQAYFTALQQAVKMDWIRKKDYASLLLNPNTTGFTPLHTALKAGNSENVAAYLTALRLAITNHWLNRQDFIDLLSLPNGAGYTPLHQAANSGSLHVVRLFLTELKNKLPTQEYRKALNQRTKGYLPSCSPQHRDARAINELLEKERRTVFVVHQPAKALKLTLVKKNNPGLSRYASETRFFKRSKKEERAPQDSRSAFRLR